MAQTLKQAEKAAKINQLDSFGSSKMDFESVLSDVEVVIGEFIKRVKINLDEEDMIVSGKIADIGIEQYGTELHVTANKWLIYQDAGVNGSKLKLYNTPYSFKDKKPPIAPFKDWAIARGLDESAAYAIRESVYQKGIAPKKIYSKELQQLEDEIEEAIGEAVVSVIFNSL